MSSFNGRPLSDVVHDIIGNLQQIVRGEIDLARLKVRDHLARARTAATLIAVGVVLAIASVFLLLLTGVYALSLVLPHWAAAMCVAVATAILSGIVLALGAKRLKLIDVDAKPVVRSKESAEWAQRQMK